MSCPAPTSAACRARGKSQSRWTDFTSELLLWYLIHPPPRSLWRYSVCLCWTEFWEPAMAALAATMAAYVTDTASRWPRRRPVSYPTQCRAVSRRSKIRVDLVTEYGDDE